MRITCIKQVRATLCDALSLWADFVTHANARYMDAIIRARPFRRIVSRASDPTWKCSGPSRTQGSAPLGRDL